MKYSIFLGLPRKLDTSSHWCEHHQSLFSELEKSAILSFVHYAKAWPYEATMWSALTTLIQSLQGAEEDTTIAVVSGGDTTVAVVAG